MQAYSWLARSDHFAQSILRRY